MSRGGLGPSPISVSVGQVEQSFLQCGDLLLPWQSLQSSQLGTLLISCTTTF